MLSCLLFPDTTRKSCSEPFIPVVLDPVFSYRLGIWKEWVSIQKPNCSHTLQSNETVVLQRNNSTETPTVKAAKEYNTCRSNKLHYTLPSQRLSKIDLLCKQKSNRIISERWPVKPLQESTRIGLKNTWKSTSKWPQITKKAQCKIRSCSPLAFCVWTLLTRFLANIRVESS